MPPSNAVYIGPNDYNNPNKPRCVIIEEPAQHQVRFRYECEGRSAGSIPGANSTARKKTYPTIMVEGYTGEAVVVVSCVSKDPPYRPHPHNLVGRQGCKKGVCTVEIPQDTMTVSFRNLGIQCVKKKDIADALKAREEIKVDPFRTGFSHRDTPSCIDFNSVRLAFQVLLKIRDESEKNKFRHVPLDPIVSNPIFHKKALSDLTIVKMSDHQCPVDGGSKEIILLCEKVIKEDIWEALGEFQPSSVHKQYAITFRPPRYKNLEVVTAVNVFVQLRRPSDGGTSAPVAFQMMPLGTNTPFSQQSNSPIFNVPINNTNHYRSNDFSAPRNNMVWTNDGNGMVQSGVIGNTPSTVSFFNIAPEGATAQSGNCKTKDEGRDLPPITIDSGDLTMTDLVCGLITPWNYPLMMLSWKMAACLAAGNTVVIKPAQVCPLTALKFAELSVRAGVPPGVINIVTGSGSVAGNAIASHPDVRKVGFTGSTDIGKVIMQTCTTNLKKLSLELGGKSPLVIFADCDMDKAVKLGMQSVFFNKGENCIAAGRIFVEASIYTEYMHRVLKETKKIVVGDPLNRATSHVPQNHLAHLKKLEEFVQRGIDDGARLVIGGTRLVRPGYFFPPTIIADVEDHMYVAKEESFGPIMCVSKFDDGDINGVIKRANSTEYGLASGVFTQDISKALKFADKIEAGTVFINTYNKTDVAAPFGGFKQSGFGKDLGQEALNEYLKTKTVTIEY